MKQKKKKTRVPMSIWCYRAAQAIAAIVSAVIFRRRLLRNELKGKRGPFVVIANHEAALDVLNLINVTRTPMHFVISNAFYSTLPIKGFLAKLGVIPKQQFQTSPEDILKMRSVIGEGHALAIYPAGLMSENGLATPIPTATYRFLQWLGVDVYAARTVGTYFVMPKWRRGGIRPGRTTLDVYRLFEAEELKRLSLDEIRERTDAALGFDAYREQEALRAHYRHGECIEGLEDVLYVCPHCRCEFTMRVRHRDTIYCEACGYAARSDAYGFLHRVSSFGPALRYPSDWSQMIYDELKARIRDGREGALTTQGHVKMIDRRKKRFLDVGAASVTLTAEGFHVVGNVNGKAVDKVLRTHAYASLPFAPGRHFDLQHAGDIYRCIPTDGRLVTKIVNTVKAHYELANEGLLLGAEAGTGVS